jgi:hypothetical protein
MTTTEQKNRKRKRNRQLSSSKTKEGVAGEVGWQFEIKMAAHIGLLGLNEDKNFKLYSNFENSGNFDDIVYEGDNSSYRLQLKHSSSPNTQILKWRDLKIILLKCLESYSHIKVSMALEKEKFDKMNFIIYTNRELAKELSEHKRKKLEPRMFFATCDDKVFNFIPDNDTNIDVYKRLENLVEESKKDMVKEFLNKLVMATGQKGHCEMDKLIPEEIKNQDPIQDDELDKLIPKEIKNQDATEGDKAQYNSIFHHFKTLLENWWRNTKGEAMAPGILRNWLQRAKTEHFIPTVTSFYNSCTMKLVRTGIKFSGKEISRLETELSDTPAVHLTSDALTLCSILLLDCLPKSQCIFVTFQSLQSNKNMFLHAWLGGHWEWLIVFCDSAVRQSDISYTCHEISENIKKGHSTKRVIILTVTLVQRISGFVVKKHKFKFEQLSKESQKMLLDKTIDFQGREVKMGSVLQRHGNVRHILGPELVTDLVTEGTAVNIGGTVQASMENYEPRVFKRKIWFSLDILRNRSTYPDMFAVSGLKKEDLVNNVSPEEKVGSFCAEISTQNNDVWKKRFIVLQGKDLKSSFSKLSEIHSGKTLHWMKYKDGKLLWKGTCGDIENLLTFIDFDKTRAGKQIIKECMKSGSCEVNEEAIWDLGERTVLVVAEPGMGKSSTTTQVAWNTKLADPTSWVVRINWNDHTRELQDVNPKNIDSLVEFLCSVSFPKSKYTEIEKILLKEALQNRGNVTVLMDGFDEVCPTHADKAAAILSELQEKKVQKLWVTSRPVQKETLEEKLHVIAFSMKKLSYESQEKMFKSMCNGKVKVDKEEWSLNEYFESLRLQANFTGCPLYMSIIASVFVKKYTNSRNIILPQQLNLLELYDNIFERKLLIYEIEKKGADLTKSSIQDDHESLKEITLETLDKCSLLDTLPSELHPLSGVETEYQIQTFVKRVQDGKDKIGIVMNVVDNKPQFVHQSIAQYFTARWLSGNFKSNLRVLESTFCDSKFEILRNVFNRILAGSCELHCAVLDWDIRNVKNILKNVSVVNDVDSGGRTALHLIAAQGRSDVNALDSGGITDLRLFAAQRRGDSVCEEITKILLQSGATVDVKDNVLQWIPLQYARQTGNEVVAILLSN